jgi:hypothetical protein
MLYSLSIELASLNIKGYFFKKQPFYVLLCVVNPTETSDFLRYAPVIKMEFFGIHKAHINRRKFRIV